jgi:1-deoxy-D-xylulose 5-phosphate reductoisomerase
VPEPKRLEQWLTNRNFPSKRVVYRVERVTSDFVLFGATEKTGKVMIPFAVIHEWIAGYEAGLIRAHQSPRDMRTAIQKGSPWAKQLHSFETHLAAIIQRWAIEGFRGK